MQKIVLYAFVLAMFLLAAPVWAQSETDTATQSTATTESVAVAQDETVTASDLGVAEPTLLPDSRLYFFKNWGRAIRATLTFNKEKKTELSARFASEKLLEVQKLATKTSDTSVLNKAIKNYQREVEKTKSLSDRVSKDDSNADKFLDKLADSQLKQQRLMDRLSKQLPPEAKEKMLVAQEKSLEQFGEMMTRLDDPEKMKERLEKAMEAQKGGEFKNFKNLEVLMRIEAKAPEQAKDALRRAQENSLNRLHGDLSQMSPEDQAKFKDYLSQVGGDELRQAEIVDRLENKGLPEGMKAEIKESREQMAGRIEKRVEGMNEEDKAKFMEQMQKGELPRPRMMDKLEENFAPSGILLPPRQTGQPSFGENARTSLPPRPESRIEEGQSKPMPSGMTIKPPLSGQKPIPASKLPLPGQVAPTPAPSQ